MSDEVENVGSMDFSKMKVNDLKKLLKSRGLSIAGVKQDLIERLQSSEAAAEALLEGSEVGEDGFDEELDKELDESALMADEEHTDELTSNKSSDKKEQKENNEESKHNEETPVPSTSPKMTEDTNDSSKKEVDQNGAEEAESQGSKQLKVNLKSQPLILSEAERRKARAERFGTTEKNQVVTMARRAERFSLNKSTSKAADSSTSQTKVTSTTTNEVLKRRAERFGILSPAEIKRQHLEKLQARKLRFQQPTVVPPSTKSEVTKSSCQSAPATTTTNGTKVTTSSLSLEERKRLRAERFKINT
uniref:Putative nucleic acid-binding protein n=1 Tax=Panstrongylus megistus TaxID=65343 RepID=A0A069DSF4_9HEMI